MKLTLPLAILALAIPCACSSTATSDAAAVDRSTAADPAPLRIGTYDTRAIAVAYAPSDYNPVGEKMAEHAAAKAAGDDERIAELEAWGAEHQRQLHRQAFARVPVTDLLAHVADRLPEVADRRGLAAIVADTDWVATGVERIDVTMDLVALYDPSERTVNMVEDLVDKDPLDLETVEQSQDH